MVTFSQLTTIEAQALDLAERFFAPRYLIVVEAGIELTCEPESLGLRFAQLGHSELHAVSQLEAALGTKWVLVLEEIAREPYVVEAKVDKSAWAPVEDCYPELPARFRLSRFRTYHDAHAAKARLKGFLGSAVCRLQKRPIRVRRTIAT